MSATSLHLASSTHEAVHAECRDAYNRYSRDLDAHYAGYFAAHPEERGTHLRQKLDDPVDWYRENIGGDLFRFVLSHPDKDHMLGIRRLLKGEIDVVNARSLATRCCERRRCVARRRARRFHVCVLCPRADANQGNAPPCGGHVRHHADAFVEAGRSG